MFDLGTWYVDIYRKKNEDTYLQKLLYEDVCSSLLYNSPKLEMTVVYSSSENLPGNKKE